jgi:orotate phosphoribosyltransferase
MALPNQQHGSLRTMENAHGQTSNDMAYDSIRSLFLTMVTGYRDRLAKMLGEKSLSFGAHKLSAGQMSDYYFDCKLTTLDPLGALLTGHCILEKLDEIGLTPDAIGGMTMGADPIVSATVVVSQVLGRPLPGFLIRKEAKEHGKKNQIEGFDVADKKVVIIDEVCTTGGSILEAIAAAKKASGEIIGIISLVDREEGGSRALLEQGYNYHSIFTGRLLKNNVEKPRELSHRR